MDLNFSASWTTNLATRSLIQFPVLPVWLSLSLVDPSSSLTSVFFSLIIHHVNLTFEKFPVFSAAIAIPSPEPAPEQTAELCWRKPHRRAKGHFTSSSHPLQVDCHAALLLACSLVILTLPFFAMMCQISTLFKSLISPYHPQSYPRVRERIQYSTPNLTGLVVLQTPSSCYNREVTYCMRLAFAPILWFHSFPWSQELLLSIVLFLLYLYLFLLCRILPICTYTHSNYSILKK